MGNARSGQSIRHRRRCRRRPAREDIWPPGPEGGFVPFNRHANRPISRPPVTRNLPMISRLTCACRCLGPCRHRRPCRRPWRAPPPRTGGCRRPPAEVRLSYAPVVQKAAPGGGQRLCRPHRHDPQSAVRGPVLPPLLRRPGDARAERAAAALARLRRAGRPGRPRRHQPPRDRRRRPGEGLARRPARVRGRDRAQGRALRSRGAADQGQRRALPGARIRRFRRAPGRRPGARDRQSVRASARP